MIRAFAIFLLTCLFVIPVQIFAKDITETFNAPKIKGIRLDWCKHWAKDCGDPAAVLFCREKGFTRAARFIIAPNLGATGTPTLVFGDGRLCQAPNCSGFRAITCVKSVKDTQQTIQQAVPKNPEKPASGQIADTPKMPPGPEMITAVINPDTTRFGNPKIKQVRVDWCKHRGSSCGKPTATLFCLEKGFKRAVDFNIDKKTGRKGIPTLFFGDGRICSGRKCRGFKHITCTRKPVKPAKVAQTEPLEPIEPDVQPESAVTDISPSKDIYKIPVPSQRSEQPDLAISRPVTTVFIPKPTISFTQFKPLSHQAITANWVGTLQTLNIYPEGASLYKCESGDCSVSNSADFEVSPSAELQSVQLNYNVTGVPHATGTLWQVAYLPFPPFANGTEPDLNPQGLLASEALESPENWFAFDLKQLFSDIPAGSGQAIFHVRVLPIAIADAGHVVGQPSNSMRIYYGAKLPPQEPYEIYTKQDVPGSRPDIRLVSLKFEPFKRIERWPPGCKTWEEKYGKKKSFLEKVGDFFSGAWDWTSGAYQWVKNRATDVASVLTLNLIPENVLAFALDSALVSVGIPPDIPNLDQLMKEGVDGLAREVAKSAVQQIPAADLAADVGGLAADITIDTVKNMTEDELRKRLEKEIEKRSRQALLTAADEMAKNLKASGKKALCKLTYFEPVFNVIVQNMSAQALSDVVVSIGAGPVHRGKNWNVDFDPGERLKLVAVGTRILPNGPYSNPLLRTHEQQEEDNARWWKEIVYVEKAEITVGLPGVLRCLGGDPNSRYCERETIIAHKSPPQLVTEPYKFEQ